MSSVNVSTSQKSGTGNLKYLDTSKAYKSGEVVLLNGGFLVQANADIAANTAFNWGVSGATWKLYLPSYMGGGIFRGVYDPLITYSQKDIVAPNVTSLTLYISQTQNKSSPLSLETDWLQYHPNVTIKTASGAGTTTNVYQTLYNGLQQYDATKTYVKADIAQFSNIAIKANDNIAANTVFNWGETGTTWSPVLYSTQSLTWLGVWSNTKTDYAVGNLVCSNATSSNFYVCISAVSAANIALTNTNYWAPWDGVSGAKALSTYKAPTATEEAIPGFVPKETYANINYFLSVGGFKALPLYIAPSSTKAAEAGLMPAAKFEEIDLFLTGSGKYKLVPFKPPIYNVTIDYTIGSVVSKDNELYMANSDIAANTPFSTGLNGVTWKPISPLSTLIIGLDTTTASQSNAVVDTDSILVAFGKLQKQLNIIKPGSSTTLNYGGSQTNFAVKYVNAKEAVTLNTSVDVKLDYSLASQSIFYQMQSLTVDIVINFIFSPTKTLTSALDSGESVSCTYIINQGATAFKVSAVQIDGTAVSVRWFDGVQPTGNANATDIYSFTIMKTGTNSFVILGDLASYK